MLWLVQKIHYVLLVILLVTSSNIYSLGKNSSYDGQIRHPVLVKEFYQRGCIRNFWFADNRQAASLRYAFKRILDSCSYSGLDRSKYHYDKIAEIVEAAGHRTFDLESEELFADAMISYFTDLQRGIGIGEKLSYDCISSAYTKSDDSIILCRLAAVKQKEDLVRFVNEIETRVPNYSFIRAELVRQFQQGNMEKVRQLQHTMNLQRWIFHFRFKELIIVNIPSAKLNYYNNNRLLLHMKVVAGKPSTRTPRFAAYCDQIIFYPYWNVPKSIAVNEILPKCQKNPAILNDMNLQVIGSNGNIVEPYAINWKSLNRHNFPYRFRQSTGCDNALGVIKFNLTSPYSIYLHDTNLKSVFNAATRYLSHGCIRIEQPVELASALLPNVVDASYLKACVKGQKPITRNLEEPVPVFIVYMLADIDSTGSVHYNQDVYKLNKQTL